MPVSWKSLKPISKRGFRSAFRLSAPTLLALGLALLGSRPAVALSCAPWGGAQAYLAAEASDRSYSVVVGTLQFDEAQLPKTDGRNQARQGAKIPALLTGKELRSDGFSKSVSWDLSLKVGCVASWCGKVRADVPYLLFVELTEGARVLQATACGDFILPDTSQVRREVLQCQRGQHCAAQ